MKSAIEQIDGALKLAEEYLVERGIENRGRVGRTVVLPAIRVARRLLAEEHAHKHTAPASHPSTAKSADRCGELVKELEVMLDGRNDYFMHLNGEAMKNRAFIPKQMIQELVSEFSKDADGKETTK